MKKFIVFLFFISSVLIINGKSTFPIVGGQPSEIKDRPYQVSVEANTTHICGGSIVNEMNVLTSAYCLSRAGADADKIFIRAGTAHLGQDGVRIQVANVLKHPLYDAVSANNDVALLQLSQPLNFGDCIQPVKIKNETYPAGMKVVVSGWGTHEENSNVASDILEEVEVEIVDRIICIRVYSNIRPVTDSMICAGTEKGGKDACLGDSGGALVTADSGILVGVVSWGLGCARPGYPGVYANAVAFLDWITANSYWCPEEG